MKVNKSAAAMMIVPMVLGFEVAGAQALPAHGFAIKGGITWPTGNAKDIQKTGFIVGASMQLPSLGGMGQTKPEICLDYSRLRGNGSELTTWGATIDFKSPLSMGAPMGMFAPYGGVGVGVFFHHGRATGGGGSGVAGGSSSSDATRFGVKLILGAMINQQFFIETNYRFTGKIQDVNTDGLQVMAGVKF